MSRRLAVGVSWIVAAFALIAGAPATAAPLLPSADPFYAYSGSLANVKPGTVLKTRQIQLADLGITTPLSATQVLYRTTGELGQPTVTVATVIRPLLAVGPTKLVSYQTAYDALGSECDPSYTLQGGNPSYVTAELEANVMLGYVAVGDAVVTSDYEGETLDYGAGQESGYGTLDAIRAAEHLLAVSPSSTPVGMLGYSGGAIATEYASELAPSYAPELDVVGTAEGGIPVDYAHNLTYINGSPQWSGVIPAIVVGLSRAFGIDLPKYLSAYGKQVTSQVADECINNFLGAYPGLTVPKLVLPQYQNVYAIPAFRSAINKMIMSTDGTPKGPLLMGNGNADGIGDGVMIANDVQELAHTYCQRNVSVQLSIYKGLDHDAGVVPFEPAALTFITERLNGASPPNGCAAIGPGNALTPVAGPAPASAPRLEYRYLGPSRRAHAVVIELATSTGVLTDVVVRISARGKSIDVVRLKSVTTRPRRVLVRYRRRLPPAGSYTITITIKQRTLVRRGFRLGRR